MEKRQPRRRDKKTPDIWIIKARVCDSSEGFEVQADGFTVALKTLQTKIVGEMKRIVAIEKEGQGYQKQRTLFLTIANTGYLLSSG